MTTTQGPTFSGRRIVELRNARGITQAELARRAYAHQSQLSRWERGEQVPGAAVLGVLAGALGCEVSDFYVVEGAQADDDDEESSLWAAAHALDRAGEYALADDLRRRARLVAGREGVRGEA